MTLFPRARPFGTAATPAIPAATGRAPLPPFDRDSTDPETGAALPVRTTLNGAPQPRSVAYRRENFCGLRVPNLPSIPGGARESALVFFPFIDRYQPADQDRILDVYQAAGYTHGTLSWPDSRSIGKSIADYVGTAKRLVDRGLYVDHFFFSKDYDPQNPDPSTVFPLIDALIDAGAAHCGTIAWEMNAFVDPDYCDKLILPLCARAPSLLWYLHFLSEYAAWQRNSETPRDFWMRYVGKIRGLKYQAKPADVTTTNDTWDAGMMQARINDVTTRLTPGGIWGTPGFDVIAWEVSAQTQFNGGMTEDVGDLRGYEALCAPGPIALMGFGNGARMPDGRAI